MQKVEFAALLASALKKSTALSIIQHLRESPGRNPSLRYINMANFYNKIEAKDREDFFEIIDYSVEMAIFNFLCLIDGVYTFPGHEEISIELYISDENRKLQINIDDDLFLHDLFVEQLDT